MNQKKKQSIVAVVATVLTVTCVMSPVASVYATETDKTITQQNEATEINLSQKNTEVLIDKNNFPDGTFREYVKTNFDKNPDDKLTTDEISNIKCIDIWGINNITDLQGIEKFIYLTELDCSDTGITSLNVSENTALTKLDCSINKQLTDLKVKGATSLIYLNCSNTGITSLDVSENKALEYLYCSNTGITSLDVSENTALTELDCSINKQLTDLKVKGATALTTLACSNTGITSLDVSSNPDLTNLYCSYNANLKKLTVKGAIALTNLNCSDTGITSLDVSNNTNLQWLDCSNTPLAYLNLGTNTNLRRLNMDNLQPVDIEVPVDTFNVTDIFPSIITKNITNINGAIYKDGVMSNYTLGENITYKYECGQLAGASQSMDVTLNLTLKSVISIQEDLSKTYDGKAVSANPKVKKEGSTKDVTYQWEQKKNANDWEDIASAPTDAGTYRVTVIVASDNKYKGATSEPKEFTISQANNDWTDQLSIEDWTYNETANNPTATAKFGTVDYLYSGSKNGTYTDVVPTNAGTWYVKASVAETENYTGLETILAFKIEAKNVENNKITVSDIKNDKDIENLVVKDEDKVLEKGIDYEVEKKQKDNKVEVVITFKGNYTGTITKNYTVNSVSAGDTTSVGLWSTILAFSAVLVVFLKRKKYKEQTEE